MISAGVFNGHGVLLRIVCVQQRWLSDEYSVLAQGESLYPLPAPSWNYYLLEGQVLERQPLTLSMPSPILANGIDEAVITGVPTPCEVTWPDGEVTEVTDGLVRFSVDLAGSYTFKFDSIPHLIDDITVEAV